MINRPINLIAAVGNQGQLGLNGKLPWHDPADLKWFKDTTMGGIVIVGYKTYESLPSLPGRRLICHTREFTPLEVLEMIEDTTTPVWIAGGAKTYELWMPFITRFYIGKINYDGPADTWLPKLPFA